MCAGAQQNVRDVTEASEVPRLRSRAGFERASKRRQQEFRDGSPTVSEHGRSPTDEKGMRHPHLLALGCEVENIYPGIRSEGGAIDYFMQRNMKWWFNPASGDHVSADKPTRNMASSQVACVNFLLPLAAIPGALLSVLRALDYDVVDVVDISHAGDKSAVEFEWIGLGGSLEGGRTRGSQNTSIDAFHELRVLAWHPTFPSVRPAAVLPPSSDPELM